MDFQLEAPFAPSADQPEAIEALVKGVKEGMDTQVLLGATGTGKTFTIAQMIQKVQRPTLVIAHNKTLAAQLASEFKAFFPHNAVEYFVSYYDYYQPSTMKSISCAILQQVRCLSGVMSLLSLLFPASMA